VHGFCGGDQDGAFRLVDGALKERGLGGILDGGIGQDFLAFDQEPVPEELDFLAEGLGELGKGREDEGACSKSLSYMCPNGSSISPLLRRENARDRHTRQHH